MAGSSVTTRAGGKDGTKETSRTPPNTGTLPKSRSRNNEVPKGQSTLDGRVRKVDFVDPVKEKDKDSKSSDALNAKKKDEAHLEMFLRELDKIREERLAIEKVRLSLKESELNLVKKIEEFERRLKVIEEKEKQREEAEAAAAASAGAFSEEGGSAGASAFGMGSRAASAWSLRSVGTVGSVKSCLTDREVWQMKNLIKEKDRCERKQNIVIKGAGEIALSELKDWTIDFLLNRLKVQVEVTSVRPAGNVIVVRLGSVEDKKLVMQNKSKLAGSKIFIENDLSYEERKLQEDINRWVKGQRESGKQVRAGFGRVWIEGKSVKWDEVKQESERRHVADDDKRSPHVDAGLSEAAAGF